MGVGDSTLRHQITDAVCSALQPLPHVLAGWESGSVAFNLVDEYSDIDLNFLLKDGALGDSTFAVVESALESVSPIAVRHTEPPGRYFKLVAGGDFLLVDVCMFQTGEIGEYLDVERHGKIRPLFDKGQWLLGATPSAASQVASRAKRREDLEAWFSGSQSFVRKTRIRGQEVEAMAAFWAYTLKPLVELLRMRYCPARWDFEIRYLQRDLPAPVYDELRDIMFVGEPADLAEHLAKAVAWGERLLRDLEPASGIDSSPKPG